MDGISLQESKEITVRKDKVYISTISTDAVRVAQEYGLGLEIAEHCTAWNLDLDVEFDYDKYPEILELPQQTVRKHIPEDQIRYCDNYALAIPVDLE